MNITRGKQMKAQRVVVYGPEGIGKSTFAAAFPAPLFLDIEGGTSRLDVARVEDAQNWRAVLKCCEEVLQSRNGFSTLVLDTIDWTEHLCVEHICKAYKKTGIEEFGYGKGYVYLAEEMNKLLAVLTAICEGGVHVVLLAHAHMKKIELPEETGCFDHWEMKLRKQCMPLVKEWADMLLFANYRVKVVEKDGRNKAQGGERVMFTTTHPCWDAKNRHGLKDCLPFEFKQIEKAIAFESVAAAPEPAKPAPRAEPTKPAQPELSDTERGALVSEIRKAIGLEEDHKITLMRRLNQSTEEGGQWAGVNAGTLWTWLASDKCSDHLLTTIRDWAVKVTSAT